MLYRPVEEQSIYDVCLMTYGTFDLLNKLVEDNMENIESDFPASFTWDETLVFDQKTNQTITNSNTVFSTKQPTDNASFPYTLPFTL